MQRFGIPQDETKPEDIAKFLVRGAIIRSPYLWKDYEDFIFPMKLGEHNLEQTHSILNLANQFLQSFDKEHQLFKQYFSQLKQIQTKFSGKPFNREEAESQRNEMIILSKIFCDKARAENISKNIFPQLEVISQNIQSRKIVQTYTTQRTNYGTYFSNQQPEQRKAVENQNIAANKSRSGQF